MPVCVLSHPEYNVVAEHQVFVAAVDLGTPISVVVHLEQHSKLRKNVRFV